MGLRWTGIVMCAAGIIAAAVLPGMAPQEAPRIGSPAIDFSLEQVADGERVRLNQFRGRVVLLDFWASWCAPCRVALPHLSQLGAKYDEMVVLAVNIDDQRRNAEDFLLRSKVEVTALFDSDKSVVEAYEVVEMPSAFLIDGNGQIREIYSGYSSRDFDRIERDIRELVK